MHRCLIFVHGLIKQYLDFKRIFLVIFFTLLWFQCNRWYESHLLEQQSMAFESQLQTQSKILSNKISKQLALLDSLSGFVERELKSNHTINNAKATAFLTGFRSANKNLQNIAIAPGGVINYVSPQAGNEHALSHAIINEHLSQSANTALQATQREGPELTNPLQLVQGGLGVIARQSIQHNGENWGLISITIDILPLLNEIGLLNIDNDYRLALRDKSGRVFHGDAGIFNTAHNIHKITLIDGYWEMAAEDENKSNLSLELELRVFQFGFAGLLSLLFCILLISRKTNIQPNIPLITTTSPKNTKERSKQPSWLAPTLATAALVIASVTFYWFLQQQNKSTEMNDLITNLNFLEQEIDRKLKANKNYFLLMSEQIANGTLDKTSYQTQVTSYIKDHPSLINVAWADSSFVIRDTAPFETNKQVIGLPLSLPEPYRASRLAYSSRQAVYTRPFVVVQGYPAFELYLPIFNGSEFKGSLGMVYSLNELIKSSIPEHMNQQYKVELLDRGGQVLSSNSQQSNLHFYKSTAIQALKGELWLRLSPQQLHAHQSMQQLLLVALLMITGIGISLWLQFRESHLLWHHNEELQKSQGHFRAIAQSSPMAIIIITQPKGEIIYANALAEQSLQGRRESIISDLAKNYCANFHEMRNIDKKIMNHESIENHELMLRNGSGRKFWASISISHAQYGDNNALICSITDLSERKKHEDKLFQQANYDSLTGLPNRGLAFDRLQRSMIRAKRDGHRVFLMMIDLDHFKIINDKFGHNAGDQVLQQTAKRLNQCLRPSDTVARLGGDEFTIILPDLKSAFEAELIAENIINDCSQPMSINGHELTVSASIGITVFPNDADDRETLLKNADIAMYKCKEDGRNHFRFYTEQMNQKAQILLSKEVELRQALSRGEMTLNYQALVNTNTNKVEGAEALLRWNSKKFGPVSPAEFIPMAESMGIINELGEWVLITACEQMKLWLNQANRPNYISVNVSGNQFRQGRLVNLIAKTLDQVGLPPEALQLEITESVLIDNTEGSRKTLEKIHDMGVILAIDDFGTGYSSLSYLRRYPFDTLKIDRAFVNDIPGDQEAEQLVNAIISMANILGLKTVAEGVETAEQQVYLSQLNCAVLQGFYLSKPQATVYFEQCCDELKQTEPC